ncbi:hypothetical protein BCR42DRAFT_403468 [Absidia repens]|uniref:DUF1682-domain-containing protein n=1 Tax=Absidia repens TaxID=90262 RepID=A0A1X2IZD5_9FUNG|nr:hypothetical protein BCR42DRAFT_403468 [Absidia repens]
MANRPLIYLAASLMTVLASEEKTSAATTATLPTDYPLRPLEWTDFITEIVCICFLILYVLIWWQGARSNTNIATKWANANVDYLREQFSLVGSGKATLVKDGPADYLLYTSGRRNVQFGHWWLKLKPRNDPVSNVITLVFSLFGWVKPIKDRMDVTLTFDKELKNKFVFAILDKTIAKDTHEKRFDLDLKMTLVYDINDTKSASLVEFPCAFVDTLSNLNLTGEVITKLNKNKAELQKIFAKREAEDRAEEIAKKKADAKRAQDERLKKLSPSEQRKFDEKERNREKKKEMKKRTKRA